MGDSPRAHAATPSRVRARMICRGLVQGVGFRPYVYRLATALRLGGTVRNGPDGVVIEVEGDKASVEEFIQHLPRSLPPLAKLDGLETTIIQAMNQLDFEVLASLGGARRRALVPPDTALCRDCREEMESPSDRRHRYPFITCTNCGPRFSIVRSLPYDRERTAMACFPLCPQCRREYTDAADRRYHAEPVCCPECGPRLWLCDAEGRSVAEGPSALEASRRALAEGKILAVKGIGGFQLACRADLETSVAGLRRRKQRPTKPFAVMVGNLDAARSLVCLTPGEETLLSSARAPVLLAPRRPAAPCAEGIAPGLDDLGIMLPNTPLHVELLRDSRYQALVMTSGNASDEPICRGNREARQRLGAIADLLLFHDRDVVRRVDDTVMRTGRGGALMVRRSRGWVPDPMALPVSASEPVLALGGYLQVTACLAVDDEAFLSQHVGDLDTASSRGFLAEVVGGLEDFLQSEGRTIVVDGHPDYPSTWLGEEMAQRRGGRLLRVQHHVAHAASVLAENGRYPDRGERAAAVVLDGTGWGPDGVAWGGEWLLLGGDLKVARVGHLEALPLVGGEAAVREPWRVLVAALVKAGAEDLLPNLPVSAQVDERALSAVGKLARESSWPLATGAGRLFEAAGALLGPTAVNGWEGEAAARLEALAASWDAPAEPWAECRLGEAPLLPGSQLLSCAAKRALSGESPALVAAGFHATFCALAARLTRRIVPEGVETVALGGGCMVNRLLRTGLEDSLRDLGFTPQLPRKVPPGDGGLAYGQAALGAVSQERGVEPILEGAT